MRRKSRKRKKWAYACGMERRGSTYCDYRGTVGAGLTHGSGRCGTDPLKEIVKRDANSLEFNANTSYIEFSFVFLLSVVLSPAANCQLPCATFSLSPATSTTTANIPGGASALRAQLLFVVQFRVVSSLGLGKSVFVVVRTELYAPVMRAWALPVAVNRCDAMRYLPSSFLPSSSISPVHSSVPFPVYRKAQPHNLIPAIYSTRRRTIQ